MLLRTHSGRTKHVPVRRAFWTALARQTYLVEKQFGFQLFIHFSHDTSVRLINKIPGAIIGFRTKRVFNIVKT